MQIFVTHTDPKIAASHLDDCRLNKMILETAQILSTVLGVGYKPTHQNHPCVKWAEGVKNKLWLGVYFKELKARWGKPHKAYDDNIEDIQLALELTRAFYVGGDYDIKFVNATTNHKHIDDVFEAYRQELSLKWKNDKREPSWGGQKLGRDYKPWVALAT